VRLAQIKLSGFKSFVDPTHIPLNGNLVGVVGPNGCGKSNVIDAVRWVLGESRASALRGDTMQDVIFNGAGDRKPVGRASVELVFDNSLGRVGGQWANYSEIAIKRVLTRDGESSYYINNQQVRRRDVADIFLGTGLGGRGYAIIEQGMISRLIEAKPEELRVFLEEAAGVSKYRERRRETELRLEDTRENLLRVDDIRQELEKQLAHLEEQAEVASRYHALQGELKSVQQLLWLTRRNEAGASRARYEREVQRFETELEAEIARLREAEKHIESERDRHYQAGEAVHAAQGELYAANAEVARLEQSLDYLRASRQRLENQIEGLRGQLAQREAQAAQQRETLESLRVQQQQAAAALEAARAAEAEHAARLPGAEAGHRQCQERLAELRRALLLAEQSRQLEETHRAHAERSLAQLEARRQRLENELAALPATEGARLEAGRAQLADIERELAAKDEALEGLLSRLPESAEGRKILVQAVQGEEQRLTELEARLAVLEELQRRLEKGESFGDWLQGHGLSGLPRLWQRIRIADGWEDALEAALRDRLNALVVEGLDRARAWGEEVPPARLTLLGAGDCRSVPPAAAPGFTPLRGLVSTREPGLEGALDEWLARVYVAESLADALALRAGLEAGGVLVTRQGHVVTRHSLTYYAPESELHGVLGRQREIEQLQGDIGAARERLAGERARLAEAESGYERLESEIETLREETVALKAGQHDLQLALLRLTQQSEQARVRGEQIEGELAEIAQQAGAESAAREAAQARLAAIDAERARLASEVGAAEELARAAESKLGQLLAAAQNAAREAQIAAFDEKTITININELENTIQVVHENIRQLQETLAGLSAEQAGFDEGPVADQLQGALETRQGREQALAAARDALEGIAAGLRESEQERLAVEQKLEPLRSRIGELKLKAQEARLNEEQFARQLADSGADEEALAALLVKGSRSSGFQAEISRLNEEIMALGAVNLAALEELTASRERKDYLDSQSADLTEAMATLEAAIKRIDRETRERLMATFDEVNRHLAELFPTLFGGGQARLVLTGEEILDSGVQIVAQPPGKRNTSIHLLSGGEKALTALSLVFSMFRLNPAPFCLLDEVDAPLDDPNTERFCRLVRNMTENTQFLFISHNKITMEMAEQLVGVTMQEQGVSHVVAVDIEEAMRMSEKAA
jgi:chromosome segregation protein